MKLNYLAPVDGYLGYSVLARNFAMALAREGIDLTFFPIYPVLNPKTIEDEVKELIDKRYDYGWSFDDITMKLSVANLNDTLQLHGRKRIHYTLLEMSKIPREWVFGLNQVDMVWTPSKWGKQMFVDSGVKEELIRVVPAGVDTKLYHSKHDVKEDMVPDDGYFKFLCLGKWEERKGQDVLVKAFAEEFDSNEKVKLFIQANNPFDKNFDFYKKIFSLNLPKHPPIQPFVVQIPTEKMGAFYRSFQSFVLPSRGEGWGLPIAEAMCCGLPVITTNVTGQTEFVTDKNTFVLRTKGLSQVTTPMPGVRLERGMKWYNPDEKHLRQLLRYVFENQDEAKKRGKQASKDMQKWTWVNAAKVAIKHLEELDGE